MSKLRVVVVEPGMPPEIRMVDRSLESLQAIVGGYIECIPIWSGHDAWVNENGKGLGLQPNRFVAAAGGNWWDIVGTFYVADVEKNTGATKSLSKKDADMLVRELSGGKHCRALLASEVEEPSITITEWKL